MPQISKIRIVNFQYNDGKRLIADELYNFESENKGPSDVLINLANGGGKSVLVQLMMQPIIPKAKVAGRKIESFFTKSTDHCFVAIEWILDGSKMKLMTGIAMAASDSSRDLDQERGFQIKYYTFISSYQDYRDNYSIVRLPLSRKEDGRFVPASFDDIRNLAKKSGGVLNRYSSDDSSKWQERLAQYGIIQNEWRLIEELNSNEDGLSKYFSGLKTSDAVIDKLIIPRIEEKQNHNASRDDSSLETMLISYARQFSRQKDIIQERGICSGFYDMLGDTKIVAEDLWKSNDSLEKCIEALFAYSDAVDNEISKKMAKADALSEEKTKLNEKIHHIQWEKASAEYHTCKEAFEREMASLREAESVKSLAEARFEETKRKLLSVECARYYGQLKTIEDEITAISTEIINRESNSESADKLASLKYSVFLAVSKELEKVAPALQEMSTNRKELASTIEKIQTELDELGKALEEAQAKKDKAEAIYEKQQRDDDDLVREIGINTFRMFDGAYQTADLDEWEQKARDREGAIVSAIADANTRIQNKESRRDSLPQDIADARNRLQSYKTDLENLNNGLSEYKEIEAQVLAVYKKYSLSRKMLFTEHAVNYMQEQVSAVSASIADEEHKIEATEEAIAAVKRGTLHIPKTLSDFLDSTGLQYTSVEKYILTQKAEGLLSSEHAQSFLSQYPFAAYGILIEEKDVETLYQEAEGKWLPAILPVFTASDMALMIRRNAAAFTAVSAYSKEYFLNSNSYADRLQSTLEGQHAHKSLLEERRNDLTEDLALVKRFAKYDENWETRTRAEITRLGTDISEAQEQIKALNDELNELKKTITILREECAQLNEALNAIRGKLSAFEKLLKKLDEEKALYREYEVASKKLRAFRDDQKEKQSQKAELDGQIKKITECLKGLEENAGSLHNALAVVADAVETNIIDGEWSSLLSQYNKLLESQSADLKHLNDEKHRLIRDKEEKEKEISRRNCNQEEYASIVYSENLEIAVSIENKEAESNCKLAEADYNSKNISKTKSETSLENAVKGLSEYHGEALPLNEIGKAFDSRISEIRGTLVRIDADIRTIGIALSELQKVQGKAENVIEHYTRPAKCGSIVLEEDCAAQLDRLKAQIREWSRSISSSKQKVEEYLKKMASEYGSESTDVSLAINSMQDLLLNASIRGDRYYTLCEHIDANMHTAQLRISQIDIDLKEFNKTKGDLIHQCVIQGRQMYEGLAQLSSNSKVRVQDKRRQMIRFDIPEAVDENIANSSIAAEIEKGAEEIAAKLAEDFYSESDVHKIASRIVGSKRLLRRYINAENIVLKAYKIDQNPDNSGYRTWEQTQINNSGAEKFVVYFAVILALMTYARDNCDDLGGKNNQSVLVLDNPFGPISSKHVLEPMFEIARNYKVQMICLSDISKSDIVSCFDLVIRAIVKQFAFGSKEQLTHEGNEIIEHGFYRAEQLNLMNSQ